MEGNLNSFYGRNHGGLAKLASTSPGNRPLEIETRIRGSVGMSLHEICEELAQWLALAVFFL